MAPGDRAEAQAIDVRIDGAGAAGQGAGAAVGGSRAFWASKRAFDVAVALLSAPVVLAAAAVIALLNPLLNPGPLLFAQERLGRDNRPFRMLKFRTMRPEGAGARRPGGAVEADRITPLGAVLRRTRIDELPQFANILAAEMSLVGPRPDWLDEARLYEATVPGYAERHRVRPGISGLAQVETGYAEGQEMTREKVRHDLRYIRDASWRQEMRILARTVRVVLTGFGAK